jgi:hypothetical protein
MMHPLATYVADAHLADLLSQAEAARAARKHRPARSSALVAPVRSLVRHLVGGSDARTGAESPA